MQPIHDFLIIHPKDGEGNEVKFRFLCYLGKPMSQVANKLATVLESQAGLDGFRFLGNYSFEASIAQTFNADEVLEAFKERLKTEVLLDIVLPPKPNFSLVK